MEFGRGLGYMRQDTNWLVKRLLGSVLGLVPILNFASVGYSMDVVRNVYRGRETPLPEWGEDFGQRLVRGFLALLIQVIYMLPLVLVACGWVAVATAGTGAATTEAPQSSLSLAALCLVPLFIIVALFLGALALVAQTRYATSGDFGAALQVGEVVSEFRSNFGRWMSVVGMAVAAGFAFAVFGLVTCGLGFFLGFYVSLAQSHWMAQAARQATAGAGASPGMR